MVSQSRSPGDDPHWLTHDGRQWLADVFLPFYDALPEDQQLEYCSRWSAPQAWVSLFLHPDLDELMADADVQRGLKRVAPLNYRKILLGRK